MEINNLCPGCMQEVENLQGLGKCPHCGYELDNINKVDHQLKPYTILAGKYIVGKVIGEGGFGISYIGFDLNLELAVAIKEFYPAGFVTRESTNSTNVTMFAGKSLDDVQKWRDGFINEAKNLAKFSNLNGIVAVKDFFIENNTAYIAMEYVDGITLKQYLKQNGGVISVEKTLEMMEPVIRSLSKVHDAGLIHRDISPDNIMITKYGGMKLLDFGAAREFAGQAEKSLSIMLKPGYAPEEQYRSRGKQGPWTDVYALCATMYKCVTGVTPTESMERMREDTLKMPKELGMNLADNVEAALTMGMAVYSEKRIQNMDVLHKILYQTQTEKRAVMPAEPVSVKPEPVSVNQEPVSMGVQPKQQHSQVDISTALEKNKKYIVAGAALILVLIVVIVSIPKGKDKINSISENVKDLATESVQNVEQEDESEIISKIKEMMSNKEYTNVIEYIVELDDNDFNADEELLRELGRQALVGHMNEAFNASDECVSANNFDRAFEELNSEINFRNNLEYSERLEPYLYDVSEIDNKKAEVKSSYKSYLFEEAGVLANNKKTDELDRLYDKAEEYLDKEELLECFCDAYLVSVNSICVDMLNNRRYSPDTIMSFVDSYFEKTNYNNLMMEIWDSQNNKAGNTRRWKTSVNHISNNGYILEGSDSRYISEYELEWFNQMELYLARWEIYARHGRYFDDDLRRKYFNARGWYNGYISSSNFDEKSLSQCEKENIKTIINYEKSKGYR